MLALIIELRSAGAWTERARGKWARAHPEPGAERRGNVAEKIPTAGAATVVGDGTGYVRPHPMPTQFAEGVDTLHR